MPSKSIDIDIKITGLKEVQDGVKRFPGGVKKLLASETEKLADETVSIVKSVTPIGRTGELRDSTEARKRGQAKWYIVQTATAKERLINPFFYGRAVRMGAKPPKSRGERGSIYPRLRKALYWEGLPHPIAVVRNHPGIPKPNDYAAKARSKMNPAIQRMANRIAQYVKAQGLNVGTTAKKFRAVRK